LNPVYIKQIEQIHARKLRHFVNLIWRDLL